MSCVIDKSCSPLLSLKNELLLNAVVSGDLPTARRLLDRHGADVNSDNLSGMSCLQLAIVNKHSKLAEYLIQKGVDIHKTDSRGWTALHDAALADNTVIVKKLISKGLSPMLTTDQGELVIDVAGSPQMERLLCEEMCKKGDVSLARQYYTYLGLSQVGKPSTAHNSFSKGNRGNLCSPQSAAKDSPKHSSNTSFYSHAGSTVTNAVTGSSVTLRFHPSVKREHYACHGNTSQPDSCIIDAGSQVNVGEDSGQYKTTDCSQISQSTAASEAVETQTTKLSVAPDTQLPTTYESAQENSSTTTHLREGSSINSLYQHSSFQLQIGLSLLNLDSQSTNLDQDLSATSPSPRVSRGRSPRVRSHRKATRTQSDPATTDPLQVHFQNPRPVRKVSFAQLPMTRTKSTTVSYPVQSNPNLLEDESSPLSGDMLKHLSEMYDRRMQKNSSSEDDMFDFEDAGVRALRKKPRKSSIVSPQRRRSSTERRRSVTFQPELLLHENVISGDAKAVSEMLESGIVQDVNKMSPAGLTALHQSAIDGNLDCAKALIRNGASVNCTDCEQWTPLHAAAMTGQAEFVRYLLLSGADATLKNDNGETAYDITKSVQVRKMLLHSMNGKSPDSNEFSDAEYSGEEEEEYSNAESDSGDESSSSELFVSNNDQEPSLKERLGLKHSSALKNSHDTSVSPSPDLDTADSVFVGDTKSPEEPPTCKRDREHSDSTSSYGSAYEPELEQIREQDSEKVDNVLSGYQASSDGEKISEDQGISTMDGSSDCSHRSRTLSEDEGTTRDVLDSELVPGSLDYKFQEACLYCDVDSVLKLVKHKTEIDVNRVNKASGITALHHAVLEENFAFTQHLIKDFEADIHIQDTDGWTPLHAASAVGNIRIAQLLLENGAKASTLNSSCEFPVDVASDEAMEKLLKNAMLGASVGTLLQGILTR